MRIAVLSTRFDGERVSPVEEELEKTGLAVGEALNSLGHEASFIHVDRGTYERLRGGCFDAAFNVCERVEGRSNMEPHAAAIAEAVGLPYTGSTPVVLALCMNKARVKEILSCHGVPTPRHQLFERESDSLKEDFSFPLLVKPSAMDNSIGIDGDSVVDTERCLRAKVRELLERFEEPVLVEEFLGGREFSVSVLEGMTPSVLPLGEIVYDKRIFGDRPICSYEAKWEEESELYAGSESVCPALVSGEEAIRIAALGVAAYRALGLRDYGRVDMRVGRDGGPQVLEVNPNPGIAPVGCGFTRAAAAAGMSYEAMIAAILGCALRRGAPVKAG